ncbi:MAG: tetratricopeptide repeat protein [Acidobacteria bacterium]|nr:tetratricopeptide repeat protein [Acidobacteriota bacterium]
MNAERGPSRLFLLVGDDEPRLRAAGQARLLELQRERPQAHVITAPPAMHWPFLYPVCPPLPAGPVIVWADAAHRAFENHQTSNTRLVTTQASYLMAEWDASLAAHGHACLVATVQRGPAARHAEEILRLRGIFAVARIEEVVDGVAASPEPVVIPPAKADATSGTVTRDILAAAFREADPAARLRLCVEALGHGRTAPALLAAASACQEVNDLDGAARDLDEAIALAPAWAALRFERGKAWLRLDHMEEAATAFQAAADRLPSFGGAWGNLGATLGELDRPTEALTAFEQQLRIDPDNPQAVNNLGVLTRELGRLSESEAAFRRVIELEPNLAFGHYNLGHTLFLQGRYQAATTAYRQGQARDPGRSPVQGSRLALCRLATGDAAGALAELQRATGAMPRDGRRQLLADTSAILWALVTHKPDLAGWQQVHDWLNAELLKRA